MRKAHGPGRQPGAFGTPELSDNPQISLFQSTPIINAQHGHWANPGLVTSQGRVYGEVGKTIVALSQKTGETAWRFELSDNEIAHSIVASSDHLFVSLPGRLIALSLEDGKLEWSESTKRGGTLTIASGLVILAMGSTKSSDEDGGEIIAFSALTN